MPKCDASFAERRKSGRYQLLRAIRNDLNEVENNRRNENNVPQEREEMARVNHVNHEPQLQVLPPLLNVRNLNDMEDGEIEPVVEGSSDEDLDVEHDNGNDDENLARQEDAHNPILEDSDISEGDESEDEEDADDHGNIPLYYGAPVTVLESMTLVLSLMLNHNLTASCVADLLTVIQMHCLPRGLQKLSFYKFRKFFAVSKVPQKQKYYCSNCNRSLASADAVCEYCGEGKKVEYFIQLPVIPQLRELYKRESFYQKLHLRLNRNKQAVDNFEDIYDGALYKQHIANGILANPNSISFTWYTDGVPVYESNNYAFWPFFLIINELPYKMRVSRENVILAGLWFGNKKPEPNRFMDSFISDFRKLFLGVHISTAGDEQIVVKGIVLAGVADTPAKSTFMNFVAHNGFHGCPYCEIRGETLRRPAETNKHVYRYEENLIRRSVARTQVHAAEAVNSPDPVVGVKGPSVLRIIMPDFIRGAGLDVMHILIGIIKKLLKLHFSPKCREQPYSLRPVLGVVDFALKEMKRPSFIHRQVSSLEVFNRWKASELKTWFFYYSVPIYHNVMPPQYFCHYLKLVMAISYLSASSISPQMIDVAENLLKDFVREFQVLYDVKYCSINIHLLLHLADCVRDLGPLWVYSCFPMENLNGLMLRTVHGKTNVGSQICNTFWLVLNLSRKLQVVGDHSIRDFCKKRRRSLHITERVGESCHVVGSVHDVRANNPIIERALEASNIARGRLSQFFRLLKNSMVYVAERYPRNGASRSCYASFTDGAENRVCMIHTFVKLRRCNCDYNCHCQSEYYAIAQLATRTNQFRLAQYQNSVLPHLGRYEMTLEVRAVPVQLLKTVCIYIPVNGVTYIGEPVNNLEVE